MTNNSEISLKLHHYVQTKRFIKLNNGTPLYKIRKNIHFLNQVFIQKNKL